MGRCAFVSAQTLPAVQSVSVQTRSVQTVATLSTSFPGAITSQSLNRALAKRGLSSLSVTSVSAVAEPPPPTPSSSGTDSGGGGAAVAVVLIILLVAAGGGGGYWWWRKNKRAAAEDPGCDLRRAQAKPNHAAV